MSSPPSVWPRQLRRKAHRRVPRRFRRTRCFLGRQRILLGTVGTAMARRARCTGSGYPTEERPASMAGGGLPMGGGQAADHRGSDLAAKGLFRSGTSPSQDPRRPAGPAGRQSGRLHLRAIAQFPPRTPATQPSRSVDLSNCTATVLGAAEIVTDNRCLGEEASWGLLELAADLLPRLMAPAT